MIILLDEADRKLLFQGYFSIKDSHKVVNKLDREKALFDTIFEVLSPRLTNTAGEFYAPAAIRSDGARTILPADFSDDDIELLLELGEVSEEDILIGRANDFAWMRRINQPKHAILAATHYLNLVDSILANWEPIYTIQYLKRVLYIGKKIKNESILNRAIQIIQDRIALFSTDGKINTFIMWSKFAISYGERPLTEDAYSKLLQVISQKVNLEDKQALLELKFNLANKLKLEVADIKAIYIERADCEISLGLQRGEGENGSSLAASAYFQQALAFYYKGNAEPDTISRAKQYIFQYQKAALNELGNIEYEIDTSDMLAHVESHMQYVNLEDAFVKLATIDNLKSLQMARQAYGNQDTTFLNMLSSSILDADGRTLVKTEPDSRNEENLFFRESTIGWNLRATTILYPAIQKILASYAINEDKIHLIISHSFLIPKDYSMQIARGLNYGIHGELMLSTALLAPIFEPLLRHYYQLMGIQSDVYNADFTQESGMLSRLLDIGVNSGKLPDAWKYEIEGHLIRKESFNIRNSVAHGLFKDDDFYNTGSLSYWWLVLTWVMYPFVKKRELEKEG